jgi:hypothetical protein
MAPYWRRGYSIFNSLIIGPIAGKRGVVYLRSPFQSFFQPALHEPEEDFGSLEWDNVN